MESSRWRRYRFWQARCVVGHVSAFAVGRTGALIRRSPRIVARHCPCHRSCCDDANSRKARQQVFAIPVLASGFWRPGCWRPGFCHPGFGIAVVGVAVVGVAVVDIPGAGGITVQRSRPGREIHA
ncbi:MAG TPA: hypothetical protein VME47_06475 [Acetobacteraceae bacterium]|nr:hypothetical protein [Acetobacteraceae bacterium]